MGKKREYYVENNISWFMERHSGWEMFDGIGVSISTVNEKGKIATSINYTIYSRFGMTNAESGGSVRVYWGIENSLH